MTTIEDHHNRILNHGKTLQDLRGSLAELRDYVLQTQIDIRREADALARVECSEILHEIIMDSKDLNVIDALEKAQKEILESLPNTPTV